MNTHLKIYNLRKEANLIYIYDPTVLQSVVSFWILKGARNDPKDKLGLAHLFEHLYLEGSRDGESEERLKILESKGIIANAFTGREFMYFYQYQDAGDLLVSLKLLLEQIKNNCFDRKRLKKEIDIILAEKQTLISDYTFWPLEHKSLWPGSILGQDYFGTKKTLNNISVSDLDNFSKDALKNACFIILGNSDSQEIVQAIKKNDLKIQNNYKIKPEPFKKPKKIVITPVDSRDVGISIAFRICSLAKSDELVGCELLSYILAITWNSRLVSNLRFKNKLVYSVESFCEYFSDTGYLNFTFRVGKKNLSKAIKQFWLEIQAVIKKGITSEELEVAKKMYRLDLNMNQNDPLQKLWWCGRWLVGGEIITSEEFLKKIFKIKEDNINQIALKYLNKRNCSINLVGPQKEISEIL